jgi:hypothetical protein
MPLFVVDRGNVGLYPDAPAVLREKPELMKTCPPLTLENVKSLAQETLAVFRMNDGQTEAIDIRRRRGAAGTPS